MVHFSTGICLSDCGVLKGFLEEFLRRAEIRTLLKWGQRSTRRSRRRSKSASSLDRSNSATMLAEPCHAQRSPDFARQYAEVLPCDVTRAGWLVAFRCLGGGDLSIERQTACARRSISPTQVNAGCQLQSECATESSYA